MSLRLFVDGPDALAIFQSHHEVSDVMLVLSSRQIPSLHQLMHIGHVICDDDLCAIVMYSFCLPVVLTMTNCLHVFSGVAGGWVQEAIRHTAKALQALTELSSQVWSEGVRNNLTEGGGANGSSGACSEAQCFMGARSERPMRRQPMRYLTRAPSYFLQT